VWTPRRIVLLVTGLLFCTGAYSVYAHLLGGVDGLPPLPPAFAEVRDPGDAYEPPKATAGNPMEKRLQEAFGANCDELFYKFKVDNRSKGVLLVYGDYNLKEADGRAQFWPCSIAIFGKAHGPDGVPEITTMHCDRAFVEFDQPVSKASDMEGRKIVAVELRSDPELLWPDSLRRVGHVHFHNNRSSTDPGDDLSMRTPGPVFYRDTPKPGEPHVYTDAVVEVIDHQNTPKPGSADKAPQLPTATASGMKVYLVKEDEKSAGKKDIAKQPEPKKAIAKKGEKKNQGTISGVDRVVLNSNVTMNLWVDGSSGFPSGNAPKEKPHPQPPTTPPPPSEKSLLQIHTDGPFVYDTNADQGHFALAPQGDPSIPNYVQVTRLTRDKGRDMLTCDYLDVQFRRRKAGDQPGDLPPTPTTAGKPPKKKDDGEMDIETVHAWGKTIVVSSDAEDLHAWGNDLVHDARSKETTLKGAPLIAVKEGNQIQAHEMILIGTEDRASQQARVRGPGQIDLSQFDPETKKQAFTRQATWQDWLVFTRVKEQGRDLDVLTLTGGARFADLTGEQHLQARLLRVWFLPGSDKKPEVKDGSPKAPAATARSTPESRARPLRLEATGQVVAHSPELDVRQADYLKVWFREVPPRPAPPPSTTISAPNVPAPPTAPAPMGPPAPGSQPSPTALAAPKDKTPAPEKRKPPIQITARRIETWVTVMNGKNELERAHCEERVAVHQDPANEGERGVDIAGHTVDLEHYLEGNVLAVNGSAEKTPGEVHFDKVSLIAEDISIDQRDNVARVKGAGSMRMLSGSTLQGEKLAQPTYITVLWKDGMEFRGSDRWARFEGGVQAEQENSRVLCETMQVMLDRDVWLKQTEKPKDPLPAKNPKDDLAKAKDSKDDGSPKVKQVVCDRVPRDAPAERLKMLPPVAYADELREANKLVRAQTLEAPELDLNNETSQLNAPGPGVVRIFQQGSKDPLAEQPDPKAPKGKEPQPKANEQEMKLTIIRYSDRLHANNKMQIATFSGHIDVMHLPADSPDQKFDVNKPPAGFMRLRCDESLEVFTRLGPAPGGKQRSYQNLTAHGNVKFDSDEYTGTASHVKYEEEKETVIFQGDRENPAVLFKLEGQGEKPRPYRAEKITYNRRTKEITGENAVGVQAN
jgi:lipopolysaccharide export system protein LptA